MYNQMKKWLKINTTFLISSLLILGSFNYFMDPLWCFQHKNFLQSKREGFNERQQKINLLHFNNQNYQGLILGSSRVTVHQGRTFYPLKILNLAADGMQPYEFEGYIQYAKMIHKSDLDYIILGLDLLPAGISDDDYNITTYINNSNAYFYRYKMLLSNDATEISVKNFRNSFFHRYKKRFKTYDEDHIAATYSKAPAEVEKIVKNYVAIIKNEKMSYKRDKYIQILTQLKKNNPNTKFIIFTTPLPEPILNTLLQDQNNKDLYDQWLYDITKIFGSVYHFCYSNDITKDYQNTFVDEGHYTTEVGNCINNKIFNLPCKLNGSDDFGKLLTIEKFNLMVEK